MNILHVLSQFEVTGAEAYAIALIEEQARQHHAVFLASDTLTLSTPAEYRQMPIGKRGYLRRLRNILALVNFIREKKIDLVHAHSRAASWVSYFATRRTNTPFVSTVHGKQHVHPSSKAFNVYGRNVIAVCESIREHLLLDLGLPSEAVVLIPNPVPLQKWPTARPSASKHELFGITPERPAAVFVGRLTGPKGDVVRHLLQEVAPHVYERTRAAFVIVGGMIVPDDIPRLASAVNDRRAEPLIVLKGFQKDIAQHIGAADVVIGSGRVVPEALVMGKRVVAFGESNYVGPITTANFQEGAKSNFGDAGEYTTPDAKRIVNDLAFLLQNTVVLDNSRALQQMVRERFDSSAVASKINTIYRRARVQTHSPASIPVLMYHRVLEAAPQGPSHGIWVTARQFANQLRSLKRRGYHPITFRHYARFMNGEQTLPPRPIILTFDDGYEDNFTVAFPLLRQFGFSAVIFAVTDERRTNFWDSSEPPARLLSSEQLRELSRHGIEIGSHTSSHSNLTISSPESVQKEVKESKSSLEQLLGNEVISFAYPYGALNEAAKQMVENAGYTFGVAADTGSFTFYSDLMGIRRSQVFPWTDSLGFWKKTQPLYYRYKAIKR